MQLGNCALPLMSESTVVLSIIIGIAMGVIPLQIEISLFIFTSTNLKLESMFKANDIWKKISKTL